MTGDALVALGSHKDLTGVSDAINKAIECLKKMQLSDGGFSSWGYENPESIAAVIRGLLACGDERTITSGDWQQESGNMIGCRFFLPTEEWGSIVRMHQIRYRMVTVSSFITAPIVTTCSGMYGQWEELTGITYNC
ncbi:MAG: hypothetical protein RJR35_03995 [Thermoanaerobacterales bacterium]|nr:hypothetical protein [Thermoanaerobacterales bacterium]